MGFQLNRQTVMDHEKDSFVETILDVDAFRFPCGELYVKLAHTYSGFLDVDWDYKDNEEIFKLFLIVDAGKRMGLIPGRLTLPYVPYSRHDRIFQTGESFTLKVFCDMINSLNFNQVIIYDPHSDVTPALLNNCIVRSQEYIFQSYFEGKNNFFLVCPDGGALKKIHKLAKFVDCEGVIECSKQRDTKTGEIVGTVVHYGNLWGRDSYIVDDICDGGKTFIEIAKQLRSRNPGKIILMVTHGFFTKGIEVFDGLIDEIYTRKGRIKQKNQ